MLPDVDHKYKGRKKTYGLDLEKVWFIPLHLITDIRTLAFQSGTVKSSVHRLVQKGKIRSHSSALKPFLTTQNMQARTKFVLKHIQNAILHINPMYDDMFNYVHIEEKWFCVTRTTQKYYLLPYESLPYRACKSKKFITKIMFMSAIARPRYDESGMCIFDVKINN